MTTQGGSYSSVYLQHIYELVLFVYFEIQTPVALENQTGKLLLLRVAFC